MAHILTLQSHVVYGHAGNAAAVFPMQRLGHQVSVVNLLQFSNHTGYGSWGGKVLSAEELQDVLQGFKSIGMCNQLDAVISGYMGSVEQAEVVYDFILNLKQQQPNVIYCCDPVMGDDGCGLYIKPALAEFIRTRLIYLADWLIPNAFELSQLSNSAILYPEDALNASRKLLHACNSLQGILATSISNDINNTGMLLVTRTQAYHCETPKYDLIKTVHGTGDVTTATFVSHVLNGNKPGLAMQKAANTLHAITQYTYQQRLTELGIIQMQEAIAKPRSVFRCKVL